MLEDSGYMARIAFVMDKLLRKIGHPVLHSFYADRLVIVVPAIMATRTLASERDRKMTMILHTTASCSAKLPIYGVLYQPFCR